MRNGLLLKWALNHRKAWLAGFALLLLVLGLGGLGSLSASWAASTTQITALDIDNGNGLMIRANQSLETYAPFSTLKLLNPARLLVDFPNAELGKGIPDALVLKPLESQKTGIIKIDIKETKGLFYRSVRLTLYTRSPEDLNRLSVQFAGNNARIAPNTLSDLPPPPTASAPKAPTPNGNSYPVTAPPVSIIHKVSYQQQALWLETTANTPPLRLSQRFTLKGPSRLVLDFSPAVLGEKSLQSTMAVSDEPGTRQIRLGQFEDATVRLVIETDHPERFTVNQAVEAPNRVSISSVSGTNTQQLPAKTNLTTLQSIGLDMVQGVTQLRLNTQNPLVHRWFRDGNTLIIQLLNVAAEPGQVSFDQARFPHVKSMAVKALGVGQPNSQFVVTLANPDAFEFRSESEKGGKGFVLLMHPIELTQRPTLPSTRPSGKFKVVVDAGHGGKDGGATRENVQEKDLNLSVALKLRDALVARGVEVVMTRQTDEFLSLQRITEISNAQAPDAFVSIHHNSSTNPELNGIETYFYHDRSRPLADAVHTAMVSTQQRPDRGVRRARFYVINHTPYPAILCEIGYVSNTAERNQVARPTTQQSAATAIAEGVIRYLNTKR
ncbi:MAG: N-acetylmuramoyl-L-alanine amidase [Vampirovibrionales bacterium]